MKILMVNKFLFPKGGAESYMLRLGEGLKALGHRVEYFGMDDPGRTVGNAWDIYTMPMDFHGSSLKEKASYLTKIINSRQARQKMYRLLTLYQPDVVHLNNFNFQLTPSVLLAAEEYRNKKNPKLRIVYTAHDFQLICPNHLLFDPIEYRIPGIVQVQINPAMGVTFPQALKSGLRQDIEVALVGEIRDMETASIAFDAANTGHMVFSTLHTVGAVNTIDRIIDIFPPNQQQQIRVQLSMQLQTVVSQQLVPAVDGGVVPVFEIMHVNPAIRNLIRESKSHQIETIIGMSAGEGMITMDNSLFALYQAGKITAETAVAHSLHPDLMEKRLRQPKGR